MSRNLKDWDELIDFLNLTFLILEASILSNKRFSEKNNYSDFGIKETK